MDIMSELDSDTAIPTIEVLSIVLAAKQEYTNAKYFPDRSTMFKYKPAGFYYESYNGSLSLVTVEGVDIIGDKMYYKPHVKISIKDQETLFRVFETKEAARAEYDRLVKKYSLSKFSEI
jgi:hypothetical protein